ncbi:iron chelate uptake ABC transporter family permease subunit [Comamonas sp. J-3]|uniref:iron chelate uptake ABC transporter family permease subunit n=1 Tax=Comamonas trifloxystrobinivorans TaxID=3350256 RepID=UPI00372AB77F
MRKSWLADPLHCLWLLLALAAVVSGLFMTLNVQAEWSFVLPLRGGKLATLWTVAFAIGVSTVLFQTVTNNRILTPAVMGFDALFQLIQSVLAFSIGVAAMQMPELTRFGMNVGLMVLLSTSLFVWLFRGQSSNLHLLLLVGIVAGIFFRSLNNFVWRIMDPNEFVVLQDRLFANFNTVSVPLLLLSLAVIALVGVWVWRQRHVLDVLALGREVAINLGVDYQRSVLGVLVVIAVLVSVSTALVGPVTFFGLLVSNMAYQLMHTHQHRYTLPATVLLGALLLVGGQMVLERVFSFNTSLSIVVEFLGGLTFIYLLVRKAKN